MDDDDNADIQDEEEQERGFEDDEEFHLADVTVIRDLYLAVAKEDDSKFIVNTRGYCMKVHVHSLPLRRPRVYMNGQGYPWV